jgi:hypothetical protein
VAIAAANPVGLIVVGGAKVVGAATGRSGLEGRAKATADEIAAQLKIRGPGLDCSRLNPVISRARSSIHYRSEDYEGRDLHVCASIRAAF